MPISIKDLSFSYGERRVFNRFDLDVADGEKIWLSAESGFGKTTLLRLICGLEKPSEGYIELSGGRISAVFQEDRLLPWFNVAQNIELTVNRQPKNDRAGQVNACLEAVGLVPEAETYPGELSGGMSRRVALARALAADFDILLLDEPFTGIDAQNREHIAEFINQRCQGKTVIIVTHDPYEAELLSARRVSLEEL